MSHKYVTVPNEIWAKITSTDIDGRNTCDLMVYQNSGKYISVLVVDDDTVRLPNLESGEWIVSATNG
jgi:hypothetical protein